MYLVCLACYKGRQGEMKKTFIGNLPNLEFPYQ